MFAGFHHFRGYAVQAYDKKCAIMSEMLRSYSRDAFDAELLVVRCKMEASNDPQGFFEDWLRRAMPLMSSQTATAIFGIYVNDAGQQVRTASCSLDVLARVIWVWVCSKKSTKAALDWVSVALMSFHAELSLSLFAVSLPHDRFESTSIPPLPSRWLFALVLRPFLTFPTSCGRPLTTMTSAQGGEQMVPLEAQSRD